MVLWIVGTLTAKLAPVTVQRDSNLPYNELNQTYKCRRCWHCCITAEQGINWRQFYKDFELPLKWIKLITENPQVHICPFLVAEDGESSCLIYTERPDMCKATFCKWMNTK